MIHSLAVFLAPGPMPDTEFALNKYLLNEEKNE